MFRPSEFRTAHSPFADQPATFGIDSPKVLPARHSQVHPGYRPREALACRPVSLLT